MRRTLTCALLACLSLAVPAAAFAADPPPDAEYSEAYFPSTDGTTTLHADILRPKGVADSVKTPVLMVVSPYLGHSGDTPTAYSPTKSGPSDRFYDFYNLVKIFKRGYTVVQVDLRGYGGSNGCGDWGGPGEQGDVKAAVEWAAGQSWSNGKVGLYGKSYDGWTGLMGMAMRPEGLAAVISQEPVVDGYRYIYMNGVHYSNTVASSQMFSASPVRPGSTPADSPDYLLNDLLPAGNCAMTPADIAQEAVPDPTVPFWAARNLIPKLKGVTTPLFLFHGFLEDNTKPDHVWDVWNGVAGPKRGWFGQWDHIRGTDGEPGKAFSGRNGFAEEAIRFLDHYVKGLPLSEAPVDKDPAAVLQREDGTWRGERQWPPADALNFTVPLTAGTYTDSGSSSTAASPEGGLWTVTPKFPHDVHMAGVPKLSVSTTATLPQANLVATVYDVSPGGTAMILSRGGYALPSSGPDGGVDFELYAQDWKIAAGHQLAVHISDNDADWFTTAPTQSEVELKKGTLTLPVLEFLRPADLDGKKSGYHGKFPAAKLGSDVLGKTATVTFPPPMKARPVAAPPAVTPNPTIKPKLTLTVRRRGTRVTVSGVANNATKVALRLVRSSRTVARKTVRVRSHRFRATFRVKKSGRYTVRASDGRGLKRSRAFRVRR